MVYLLLLTVTLLTIPCTGHCGELRILTENVPPLNYIHRDASGKEELVGQSVDIVKELQRRLNDKSEIQVLPWARAFTLTQQGPNTMLFSVARTKTREDMFQWVGPVGYKDWVFLALKGSPIRIEHLDEAKKIGIIATYRRDVRGEFLREEGFENLEYGADPQSILKKMLAGRNDLWIASWDEYVELAKLQGVDPESLVPIFTAKRAQYFLAFSKDVPAAVVRSWADTLESMRRDGSLEAIQNRWEVVTHPPVAQ